MVTTLRRPESTGKLRSERGVSLIQVAIAIFVLTGFFVAMWLLSAQLFRKAARQDAEAKEVT